jgi:hypothetical protein
VAENNAALEQLVTDTTGQGRIYWGGGEHMAEGHCEGHEAETTSILQSEWEAKKRSIATLLKTLKNGYRFSAKVLLRLIDFLQ